MIFLLMPLLVARGVPALAAGQPLAWFVPLDLTERKEEIMDLILLIVVLVLLFGGGGFYWTIDSRIL